MIESIPIFISFWKRWGSSSPVQSSPDIWKRRSATDKIIPFLVAHGLIKGGFFLDGKSLFEIQINCIYTSSSMAGYIPI